MNYRDLDLNLIKIFLTVYESKSISLASKKMFLSQPAVTNSIKRLEKYLGGDLFIRTPKGLIATEEGNQFNGACYNAMKILEKGIGDFSSFASLEHGKINIGSSSTIIRKILMPFIADFSRKHPNISISVTDANSSKLIKILKLGEVDIVIMNTPIENEEMFHTIHITQTHDCFIANAQFEKDFLDKSELVNYPLIVQKRPSNNRDYFEKMCTENQISLQPKYEIGSFGLITDFVASNMGIAYTIQEFVMNEVHANKIKLLETNLKISPRKISVVGLKAGVNSFATKKFIDELVAFYKREASKK